MTVVVQKTVAEGPPGFELASSFYGFRLFWLASHYRNSFWTDVWSSPVPVIIRNSKRKCNSLKGEFLRFPSYCSRVATSPLLNRTFKIALFWGFWLLLATRRDRPSDPATQLSPNFFGWLMYVRPYGNKCCDAGQSCCSRACTHCGSNRVADGNEASAKNDKRHS